MDPLNSGRFLPSLPFRRFRAGGSASRPPAFLWLAFAAPLACGSPSPVEQPEAPRFTDVAAESGLDFVHINGMSGQRYFVEMMGAGGAFLDYDNDGDLDVYLVQGRPLGSSASSEPTPLDRLYRNDLTVGPEGDRALSFTDITESSGIEADGYGMGVAVGDYDNDGWSDLYVLNWGSNQLWRNNGDGTFSDVTAESGADDPRWSTGASFLDFDLDGWLDLVIVNYSRYSLQSDRPCYTASGRRDYCGPDSYPAEQDRLLRNLGDGRFEDVTLEMGIGSVFGPALGVAAADFDSDGWPDIYVANDRYENQLWINRGGARFEDRALVAGTAVNVDGAPEASMGVAAQDFNGDGATDIFISHLARETNTLYVNSGNSEGGGVLFQDRTRSSGLGAPSLPHTGFGVAPLDYDNDGWLDLFVANGAVVIIPEQAARGDPLPLKQRNLLFRNRGDGSFQDATPDDAVFNRPEVGRGTAYGDVDGDGDTDLLVTNNNGPARLLRNELERGRAWLGLRLVGTPGRRDMLGAGVAIVRASGQTLWRRVHTDGSYLSAHDPRILFGLGRDGSYETIRVTWPDGRVEVWDGLEIGAYHTLEQGAGRTAEVP